MSSKFVEEYDYNRLAAFTLFRHFCAPSDGKAALQRDPSHMLYVLYQRIKMGYGFKIIRAGTTQSV
jgi:hypothetical protein